MNIVEVVARFFESIGAPYALIGARAIGVRGYPRMTVDYDFLVADPRLLDRETWRSFEKAEAATADPRKGDLDDPLAGVVHLAFETGVEADIVVAKWKWELEILQRAERLDVGGVVVPVPVTSDLILLKLAAGGPIDLQDVVALVETDRSRWIPEVDQKIARVQPDVSATWNKIKSSL